MTPRSCSVMAGMARNVSASSRQTVVKKRLSMVKKFPAPVAFVAASTRNTAANTTQTPISSMSDFFINPLIDSRAISGGLLH